MNINKFTKQEEQVLAYLKARKTPRKLKRLCFNPVAMQGNCTESSNNC